MAQGLNRSAFSITAAPAGDVDHRLVVLELGAGISTGSRRRWRERLRAWLRARPRTSGESAGPVGLSGWGDP
jgi:hypothetical protein